VIFNNLTGTTKNQFSIGIGTNRVDLRTNAGTIEARSNGGAWFELAAGGGGSGDMTAAVYDPTSVEGDAFDMGNMVESAANLILTVAERAAISASTTHSGLTNNPHSVTATQAQAQKVENGIEDPSQLSITYNAATRQFTIVNSGTTVAVNGVISTPVGETTAAHADTTGTWWLGYGSGDTTATVSQTLDFATHIPVGRVYFDQPTASAVPFEERHSQQLSARMHRAIHKSVGARLENSPLGCAASGYTVQEASPTDAENRPLFAAGVMYDEDIPVTISAVATETYTQAYWNGSRLIVTDGAADLLPTGVTYAQYNNAGTLTEITNNQYVNAFVFAWTRTGSVQIVSFVGESVHATLEEAQAEQPGDISFPSGFAAEIVPLYQFTFRGASPYGTAGKTRIAAVEDYRGTLTGAQVLSGTAVEHNTLASRDAPGAHPADALSYDNTTSGLTAAEVQAALDELAAEKLQLNADGTIQLPSFAPDTPAHVAGKLFFDSDDQTAAVMTDVDGTILQLGHENVVKVVNTTGATLDNGNVIYINGAQGNRPTVALADADVGAGADTTLGVITSPSGILTSQEGYAAVFGIVRGIDTTGWTAGDDLYLSQTAGELTNVAPASPAHAIHVGYALNSTVNGSIFVNVISGVEIGDLHDVNITTLTGNQILRYDSASSLWVNESLGTAADYNVPAAGNAASNEVVLGNDTRLGTDSAAIHDNVAGEIAAVAAKATPVSGDLLLIEDSADSNSKKRITIGSLPGGGGGGISWDTITASTTATAGSGYAIVAGGNVTLTLPLSPTDGDEVWVVDAIGAATTYTLTVARNGEEIEGAASDLIIDVDNAGFGLVYFDDGSTNSGWKICSEIGSGPASQWREVPASAYTGLPASTSSLTMSSTDGLQEGQPIRFTIGGTVYKAEILRITTDSLIEIRGHPLSGTVTKLEYGADSLKQDFDFTVPGRYADSASTVLLNLLSRMPQRWQKGGADIVALDVHTMGTDSGATQPIANVRVNNQPVCTSNTNAGIYVYTAPSAWTSATAYSRGDRVTDTVTGEDIYECTVSGTSGGTEPTWDTDVGDTTTDNTVTWIRIDSWMQTGVDISATNSRLTYGAAVNLEVDGLSTNKDAIDLTVVIHVVSDGEA